MDASRSRRLIESGLLLASEGVSLDGVLDRVVELAMDVTEARYGAIGVLDEEGTIERFITKGVTDEQRAAIGDPPTGKGILGVLIQEGHALRLPDIGADPRSVGFPPNHPPMRAFLGAPVVARGRVFGRIYLTEKEGGHGFTDDDERAAVVLAAQAGTAIENARLYEETERQHREIERLRVSEERERIAKELHDGVIQSLFAVGMGLQGAGAIAHDPEVATRIEHAVDEIDHAIRDLRNYIFGLRPGVLADRQLDTALVELAEDFETRSGVVTVVDVDDLVASELAGRATDVVQLTRELLSNVARHAQAATCRVSLSRDDAGAVLVVDDDGVGFDADAASTGMGLANVRGRVEPLGGALEIESAAGSGTTVRVRIPR
ncbi:MAG TPA: GAF domain-containing sensor histidine kinase [Actinomycetota bacterium]